MYCCNNCDATFEEYDHRLEDKTHDGYFICPECGAPLSNEESKIADSSDEESFYCYECEKWHTGKRINGDPPYCSICGEEMVDKDMYDDDCDRASDPLGDLGGPNGLIEDEEGNLVYP